MFDWLRPKAANAKDLDAQLEAARTLQVSTAEAVILAQREFDESGDDSSLRMLSNAREAERIAHEHVERAERLLAERKRADEQHRRAVLADEEKRLDAELGQDVIAAAAATIQSRKLDLLRELARVGAEANTIANTFRTKSRRRDEIIAQLEAPVGATPRVTVPSTVRTEPITTWAPAIAALRAEAKRNDARSQPTAYQHELTMLADGLDAAHPSEALAREMLALLPPPRCS